jgi:serine kinase of HPr protein (carbohydrate metabolism regulator)
MDSFLVHGSAICVDGKAYLFSAPSGTGKSTHARLWREMLGDRAVMVNDDKPFIRYIENDGCFYVYGSPWQGKHHRGANVKIPLKAICLLNRGIENKITKINSFEALSEILTQTVKPTDELEVDAFMNIISLLTEKVDFYKLYCNMESDAPKTSFNEMINKY